MSKELTEQWRNGTLEQKYYYVKYFVNGQKPFVEIELKNFLLDLVKVKDRDKIEVLASVPTYDQFANASKKVEKLETQLKEANEVIKYYANSFCGDKQKDGTYLICTRENALGRVEVTYNPNIANDYLERYGVK